MISFEFVRKKGVLSGFTVSGHSGYAEQGADIVCAAVSSAVRLCCNGVTETARIPARVTAREENAEISLSLPKGLRGEQLQTAGLLLESLLLEAGLLAEEYPDFVKVTISEDVPRGN